MVTYCVGILGFHKSRPLYIQSSTDTMNLAGVGAKRRHMEV